MKHLIFPLCIFVLCGACSTLQHTPGKDIDPLKAILHAHSPEFDSILSHPEQYEVQIIYTRIDRDAAQRPHFTSFYHNTDSARYFYPASMVKMPLALLALEQINHLRASGENLDRDTPYALDSVRAYQQQYKSDASAPGGKPSLAQDIRQIFTVSDNLAYNHLFEFLGRAHINETLRKKGYNHTGIVHRFNYPGRDNRYASPMAFFSPVDESMLYRIPERFDSIIRQNPQYGTTKGIGYYNAKDSLVRTPFDLSGKNWFALTDMEKMLRAVLFPEAMPPQLRFDLNPADYRFLWHYMGIFPRECDYPRYDSTYYDGYAKFLLFGDSRAQYEGSVRSFNKIGEAYGTLTDVAYIVDFKNKVEFVLAATILCNSDGIFNDDRYDYDRVGVPFLARLGRAVYEYELGRKRAVEPDLGRFYEALK